MDNTANAVVTYIMTENSGCHRVDTVLKEVEFLSDHFLRIINGYYGNTGL